MALPLAGFLLFLSASIVFSSELEVPKKNELYLVSGFVESFTIENVRRGGKNMVIHISSNGETRQLLQQDFTKSEPELLTLRRGDEISALVIADSLGRDFDWIWELHRGENLLLSYEQIQSLKKPNAMQYFLAAISFAFAVLLIYSSLFRRRKSGTGAH